MTETPPTNKPMKLSSAKPVLYKDSLESYLAQIQNLPMLSREEERALALKWYETRDREAGQKLVLAHLRFVVKIAKGYTKYGFKLPELIQEGNLGLLHAIDKYDPNKGYRLVTYAVWWIRAYIQSFVLRSWSVVRTGTTRVQRKLFSSLQKARRFLAGAGEDDPSRKQLADVLEVDEGEFSEALDRMEQRDVSLDAPVSEEGSTTLGDTMADSALDPESLSVRKEILLKIHSRMDDIYQSLSPRDRFVLENRLLTDTPMTLEDIGAQFGVTRERVRQIENRLKEKLRKELAPAVGEDDLIH